MRVKLDISTVEKEPKTRRYEKRAGGLLNSILCSFRKCMACPILIGQ
jgi:hypothetical protein